MSEETTNIHNRQEQKKSLRRKILPDLTQTQVEDLEETLKRAHWRKRLRIFAILAIALLVFAGYRLVAGMRKYTGVSVIWENTDAASGDATYTAFGKNLVKVSADGISYIGTDGKTVWNYGYQMKNPTAVVNGSYGAVADLQAESAVIFNEEGVLGTVNTTLEILNLTVSSHGVLALVLDDSDVNYVNFYDRTGETLDIRIKTSLSGDGYPMDISLSPTGTGMAASVVYLDQGALQSQIAFYNFDVGKDDANRIVGYFPYDGMLFPEVQYLNDETVCAIGEEKLIFYSLKNESKPEVLREVELTGEVESAFTGEDQVGLITQEDEGRTLTLYGTKGQKISTRKIDFEYSHAEFSNGYALVYSSSHCLILNARGQVRFAGQLAADLSAVVMTGSNSCMAVDGSSLVRMRLK